jgi:Domain of unknown function (DUF6430)
MFTELFKQRFHVILLVFGFLLVLAGLFTIKDFSKFDVAARNDVVRSSLAIGVVLIAIAVVLHLIADESFGFPIRSKVKKTNRGYAITKGHTHIQVLFGRIEEFDCSSTDCLVALPANEFFDDECIDDTRSALGAFIQRHFGVDANRIQRIVARQLSGRPSTKVEKEGGSYAESFGVGTCVFLDRPLAKPLHIAMLAVTTKRAGEGLRAEARHVLDCVAAAHRLLVDHRLSRLYIPVLGSGHGGLRGEVSLLCMLIGLSEALQRPSGHHLQEVNIVVFQSSETSAPTVAKASVRRALAFVDAYS